LINYKEECQRAYSTLTVFKKDSRMISNKNIVDETNNSIEENKIFLFKTKK